MLRYLVLSILFLSPSVSGQEALVDAFFDVEFKSATNLKIFVDVNVEEIRDIFGETYTREEIKDIAESNPEILGAIKQRIYDLLRTQIDSSFEKVTIFQIPTYEDYIFHSEFDVILTSSFFGMNETVDSHDLVNGILDMGAIISYNFNLKAQSGWNNTYTFILPHSLEYRRTTGTVKDNKIQWRLKNRDGRHPELLAELSLQKEDFESIQAEEVSLEFEFDATNINNISLTISVIAGSIDLEGYENVFPPFAKPLDYLPSDGIRLFVENGLLSWDDVYQNSIKPIQQRTKSIIENSSFNQTLDLSFEFDPHTAEDCPFPYNVTNMDGDPPIKAFLVDRDINLRICNISARAFFGLINAGASANITSEDINFGNLGEIGYSYQLFLRLPEKVFLNKEKIWNMSKPGNFLSEQKPSNEKESIEVKIEIDKIELNLPSFFTGKTELTATTIIEESNSLFVISPPQELPKKISLPYLNSDAFRLCVEEEVFSKETIESFLESRRDSFEERLKGVLKNLSVKGFVDKEGFYSSLAWDGDISSMEGITPILIPIRAHNLYPIPFNLSFWPPKIEISNLIFYLKGSENQPVTYTIIFPEGITVKSSVKKEKTGDGRECLRATINPGEALALECAMSASPLYVLGVFLPCLLSLVLIVILMTVIYLLRKKRKGKEPEQGFEGREYYVPPK